MVATLALAVLSATSLLRTRLRLSYEGWRRVHLALGLVLVVGGAAHALLVGHYLAAGLLRELTIGLLALSLAGVLFLRVGRPLLVNRRYVIDEVTDEPGGVITVHLRADGHVGVPFAPGHTRGSRTPAERSGWSSTRSRSPPAHTGRIGPPSRSARWGLHRQDPAGVAWSPGVAGRPARRLAPQRPKRGIVLLVAGIGVTPAMSLLRTFDDERRSPPVTLRVRQPRPGVGGLCG